MMGANFSGELQFNLTSLRFFVKENYLRSRREQDSDTKHEKSQKHDIMHRNDINMSYLSCILSYFVIYGIMMGAKFSGELQFNLTSLRLFVKENYLRSRREQDSDTKHEKSLNSMFCLENDINPRYYCVYWHILLFVVL